MARRTKKQLQRSNRHFNFSNLNFRKVLIVVLIGIFGLFAIQAIKAATYGTGSEAENGTLSGNASTTIDSTASGSNAVSFGSNITPSNLQVYTGGNNIALVWDMPSSSLQSIQVFRNNQQVATVTPNSSAPFQNGQLGKEYDDNSVTAGMTYQYQIRAVNDSGGLSSFTPAVSATQPTNSQPVPTITVDTSAAPTLASYMNNNIVPLLHTWYPKVANKIAYPNYTAPTSFTIKFQANLGNFCETGSGAITCDPSDVAGCAAAGSSCAATFVHESTHVIQNGYPNDTTGWATEGMASWASDYFARQNINPYIPHPYDQLSGYTIGAFFINYIYTNYGQSFPKDLNVSLHNNTYTSNLVPSETGGKSVNQVWQEAVNKYSSFAGPTGVIKSVGGKCVEVQNGAVTDGTKLVLDTCNSGNSQKWAAFYQNAAHAGKFELISPALSNGSGLTYCADDSFSGTADGTNIQFWGCDDTNAQFWTHASNGSIVNVNANKCLDTTGSSAANGAQIVVNTCNGSASQNWTTP